MSTPQEDRRSAFLSIKDSGTELKLTHEADGGGAPIRRYTTVAADWDFDRRSGTANLVQEDDIRLVAAAETEDGTEVPTPSPSDEASYGGACYRVVRAKSIRKAGVAIIHDLHLRKN